jgi:hypothetical protein
MPENRGLQASRGTRHFVNSTIYRRDLHTLLFSSRGMVSVGRCEEMIYDGRLEKLCTRPYLPPVGGCAHTVR